uniref:Hepcidin n=1 Tax=Kalanchoe fedtschenkoi TaxID=63787 RepID=A0A7N0ZTT3_KALFE
MEPKIVAFGVLLTVLLLSVRALAVDATPHSPANGSEEMVPVMDESVRRMELRGMFNLSHGGSRRKLGSFQICAVCTCCGGITRKLSSPPFTLPWCPMLLCPARQPGLGRRTYHSSSLVVQVLIC